MRLDHPSIMKPDVTSAIGIMSGKSGGVLITVLVVVGLISITRAQSEPGVSDRTPIVNAAITDQPTEAPAPQKKYVGEPCQSNDECLCGWCFLGRCFWEGCLGDCNGSGDVTIDEILTLVKIALDEVPGTACCLGAPDYGHLDITEIIIAVNFGLTSCPN